MQFRLYSYFSNSCCLYLQDETTKRQGELNKIREVLIIQDVLSSLEEDEVRQDFIKEQNGACKVEESELEVLDKL